MSKSDNEGSRRDFMTTAGTATGLARVITGNTEQMLGRFCKASALRSYFPVNARPPLLVVPNGTGLPWFAIRTHEPYYKWPNLKSIKPLVEIAVQVWKAR
ncbi:MAG: twin-arginine translocation signal domain-containing protein [Gammaproteobacteria bacterium]|nr:twin-arginine translocation signal domain-containing protein [Gammaproteobacteria bacterium]